MKMAAASLGALWRGELPVTVAFWRYLVIYGLFINLAGSLAMLLAFAASVPAGVAILLHFLPLPYNALAAIGVWRSSGRAPQAIHTEWMKLAASGVFLLWLVI
jgi:hypothetical protein